MSGTSILNISSNASVDISGKLTLTAGSTLNVSGAGLLEFSAPSESGHADIVLRSGAILNATPYNSDHGGAALAINHANLSIGPNSSDTATLAGNFEFGGDTELKIRVEHDGSTTANSYIINGDAGFKQADVQLQLGSGLEDTLFTALDLSGTMTSLWKDIHYSNVSDTQIFRPYLNGNDLKVEIITNGISTTSQEVLNDPNANYVYAETGADVFYVKGADVIFANDGDDRVYIQDQNGSNGPAFAFLDGGSGTNTLSLQVDGGQHNLNAYAPWVQNFDVVAMDKSGSAEQVYIGADAVQSILGDKETADGAPTAHALIINGGAEDIVNLTSATGNDWTSGAAYLSGYTGYTSTDSAGREIHLYIQDGVVVQQVMSA